MTGLLAAVVSGGITGCVTYNRRNHVFKNSTRDRMELSSSVCDSLKNSSSSVAVSWWLKQTQNNRKAFEIDAQYASTVNPEAKARGSMVL
jgi:hypothetical protein